MTMATKRLVVDGRDILWRFVTYLGSRGGSLSFVMSINVMIGVRGWDRDRGAMGGATRRYDSDGDR